MQQIDGSVVKSKRLALGLSRETLAARAPGGLSSATIRRLERGEVTPRPKTLVGVASALGCHPKDLEPAANGPQGKDGHGHAHHQD